MFFVDDRYGGAANVEIKSVARGVKVGFFRFLDAMAMARHLAVRENGMRQLLADLGEGIHCLDQDIAVTILISHGAKCDTSAAGSNSEIVATRLIPASNEIVDCLLLLRRDQGAAAGHGDANRSVETILWEIEAS